MSVFRYINNTSTGVTDGTNIVPAWDFILTNTRVDTLEQFVNAPLQLLVNGVEANNYVEKVVNNLGVTTLAGADGKPVTVPPNSVLPIGVTDRSGTTHATAGTSKVLMPANTNRIGFSIQNNSMNIMAINLTGGTAVSGAGSIYVAGAGVGSIFIQPGCSYTSDVGSVTSTQITIACGRANATYHCSEYFSINTAPLAKVFVDRSGIITSGSIAQSLFTANASRTGYLIQNLSKVQMFVQATTNGVLTGLSRKLNPYDTMTSNSFGTATSAFSIICRVANNAYTAMEY